jgi:hypothetical protein
MPCSSCFEAPAAAVRGASSSRYCTRCATSHRRTYHPAELAVEELRRNSAPHEGGPSYRKIIFGKRRMYLFLFLLVVDQSTEYVPPEGELLIVTLSISLVLSILCI